MSTAADRLEAIRWEELGNCTRCPLHESRTKLVFGSGNPDADMMFVGEGPGFHEDKEGSPFVGNSGQVLSKMIEHAGTRREKVYIANVVKCRPPKNRDPRPEEVETCSPYLRAQIAAVRPKVLVALGRFAANTLSRQRSPLLMATLRERTWDYTDPDEGMVIPVISTYHPSYVLRQLQAQDHKSRTAARNLYQSVVSDVRRAVAMSQPLDLDL